MYYVGLHRVARRNPAVNDIIASQLSSHAATYIQDRNSQDECPVKFKEIFDFSPTGGRKAAIKDELGFLIQSMGFVYNMSVSAMDYYDQISQTKGFKCCKEMLHKFISFGVDVNRTQIDIVC